jgi:chemotaxis methyl-accepting protein methylase
MDDGEFARWVDLLERRTGVVVPPGRKTFLVTGVRSRMRETGHQSYREYFEDLLAGARGAIEWAALGDPQTLHETPVLPHRPAVDPGRNTRLAEPPEPAGSEPLHAWSVGCSTGEEAYSLAMVLDEGLRALSPDKTPLYGVTATDISAPALSVGRVGEYPLGKLKEIPASYRNDYWEVLGQDCFVLAEPLRKRVGFAQFNLLDMQKAPLKRLDLIFCQNVLIYFARERRGQLLDAMAQLLKPGGLLVVGPGEVLGFTHSLLTRVGGPQTLAFQRKA